MQLLIHFVKIFIFRIQFSYLLNDRLFAQFFLLELFLEIFDNTGLVDDSCVQDADLDVELRQFLVTQLDDCCQIFVLKLELVDSGFKALFF